MMAAPKGNYFTAMTPQCWFVAGICGILGSTYTGEYEDIEKLDRLVEKLNKEKV